MTRLEIKKLQYDINREAAKILPPDQSRLIKQAKFTYLPLGKAFEKQKQLKIKEKESWSFKSLKNQ